MHVGAATSGASRRIVSPSGGATLRVSGFGFEPFSTRQHDADNAWDDSLIVCRFTDDDGTAKETSVYFTEAQGVANTHLPNDRFTNDPSTATYRPIINANCLVPPLPETTNATVALMWKGTPTRELHFRGIPGNNVLEVLEFATHIDHSEGVVEDKTAVPIVHGFGFTSDNTYYCRWALANDDGVFVVERASFRSSTELACDSFPAGGIAASFDSDEDVQVTITVFFSVPGDSTKRPMAGPPPGSVWADGASSAFTFPYKRGACGDGIQNQGEIGVDCGYAAGCGYCEPGFAQVGIKGACELTTDCATRDDTFVSCRQGQCLAAFSCKEILEQNPEAESGQYKISVNRDVLDLDVINPEDELVGVYCEMDYDEGGWTLFEMVGSSQSPSSPFNYIGDGADEGAYVPGGDIGVLFAVNQNQPARLPARIIRSIFKHSAGYVQMRYANNADGYQLTDVYGVPETGTHFLDQSCSHKPDFDIAKAMRPRSGSSMGFCFRNGAVNTASNCVCGDRVDTTQQFNACPLSPGNRRRYNSFLRDKLWCSGMHRKCYSVSSHYVLGDTYSCNKGGQRSVEGHMWRMYSGNTGMPCTGYGAYGCYGSVWMR
ncbi:hypothetical protein PTSG_08396 [Salpingoeca rosetta]|uniref:Fibrinogen C-terminal domain-containing protein n=1 Tax=Salpingoeca rosetta (strain ATCC 50818 / BSB-021) TaxID=946362 RepID=F2UJK3_SALR5|nr:uncharacterized protein PTSG_08396 [Salpingoeca rosetta]EGD77302.1 hypothetical protein PTSG_08396 [Salpingoeca rosetta]|eukprot:XP_004990646.1 hypothetical protein PTSG_08396 [Salpingoeca rosetta]